MELIAFWVCFSWCCQYWLFMTYFLLILFFYLYQHLVLIRWLGISESSDEAEDSHLNGFFLSWTFEMCWMLIKNLLLIKSTIANIAYEAYDWFFLHKLIQYVSSCDTYEKKSYYKCCIWMVSFSHVLIKNAFNKLLMVNLVSQMSHLFHGQPKCDNSMFVYLQRYYHRFHTWTFFFMNWWNVIFEGLSC